MVVSCYLIFKQKTFSLHLEGKGFLFEVQFQRISTTKTAQYVSVYKAVLTVFMLYDYDKNIDIIPTLHKQYLYIVYFIVYYML